MSCKHGSNCGCKRGLRGLPGLPGPPGPAGAGAIIPFASGEAVAITHVVGGATDTGAVMGFGASLAGVSVGAVGASINLNGGVGVAINMAFNVPRAGTLTSFSALYSNVAALAVVGATITLRVQIFRATPGNNTFAPVAGALVDLPIPGVLALGGTSTGNAAPLAVPVAAGERLVLVARITGIAPADAIQVISGYISAGLGIS